jgi:hypothetical protein
MPPKLVQKGGIKEIPPRALQPKNSRNPKIEHLYSQIWEGNHSPKNHEGFPQIFPIKSPRERSRKQPKEITKRGIGKSPPRTTGENTSKPSGTTPNHLYMKQRFIQGIASRPIIHPSQQDLSMKLSC